MLFSETAGKLMNTSVFLAHYMIKEAFRENRNASFEEG